MQSRVKWIEERTFVGISGSGHTAVMDGSLENGGRNLGMRPMEMLLTGLGGCSSFDIIAILYKSRQQVTDCECILEAQRAESDPKVFKSVAMHFVIKGKNLKEESVKRAVNLSTEKYCSASIMFERSGCTITHSYEIIET